MFRFRLFPQPFVHRRGVVLGYFGQQEPYTSVPGGFSQRRYGHGCDESKDEEDPHLR